MIIYYNSYTNGYNQTLNTNSNHIANENLQKYLEKVSCKCAKINKENQILEIYSSYHDAARKNGMDGDNCATKIRNVCKGKISCINNELIEEDVYILQNMENELRRNFIISDSKVQDIIMQSKKYYRQLEK